MNDKKNKPITEALTKKYGDISYLLEDSYDDCEYFQLPEGMTVIELWEFLNEND